MLQDTFIRTRFFKTYKVVEDVVFLYMENFSNVQVLGKGSLSNLFGFKLVFEVDKAIISKGGVFVGKGYVCDGMSKLSINNINNASLIFVNHFLYGIID